ncbi:hypothetical protein [Clostridium botulinum]|uniref:hypothetical protein n=1 Tax=Clostridium botulinum TaxID=1491 RepID=UPI0006AC053B|nr:hypothetical protein [Clostridium botulinum]KOR54843.1 hypothetical protein ADT23_00170 [Clostridium botulinum]MBY6839567.1 hypothetical protein [Clostridium botulinum]MCR1163712.1 hypothetical protein [Clostridium botulinum]NFM78162.1 hypothetical protein [Clostridium botulinum]NFN89975.1 hypothetical protein [Clostridium botulinum]
MSSIGVSVYALSMMNKQTNEEINLNDVKGENLIDIFINFMDDNNELYTNKKSMEKIFKTEDYEDNTYEKDNLELFRYSIGRLKTGAYGYSAEIVDANTGDINYNRGIADAEVMPFFFYLCVSTSETNRGILLLETKGIYGVKTIFYKCFQEYLNTNYKDIKLSIRTITPITYVDKYLRHGILQKIRFIRYNVPHDTLRQLGMNNGTEQVYDEYIIHKPLGFLDERRLTIRECILGQSSINNVIEIDGFEYENIKLEFKFGGKNKTINLSNIENISVNEDITNKVTLENGHPTKQSITPVLENIAVDYLNEMGLI